MKTCPKCGEEKPLNEFYNRRGKLGGSAYCKPCNKQAVIDRTSYNKYQAIQHFGGRCSNRDCATSGGYSRCGRALHFHHPDPSNKDDLFHRLRYRSFDKIIAELERQGCVLLCANCHAEEHCEGICSMHQYNLMKSSQA